MRFVWILAACAVAGVALSIAAHARLAIFRHDQRWRRERGDRFGERSMALWWGEEFERSQYAPEGQRLVPWVIAIDVAALLLTAATVVAAV